MQRNTNNVTVTERHFFHHGTVVFSVFCLCDRSTISDNSVMCECVAFTLVLQ